MKNILSFFLLLTAVPGAAQVTTSLRAGVSFAGLHYKSDMSSQGRVAGYAGLSFQIELEKQFFVQPEILYSMRGYRFPATATNSSGRVAYGYITAPLLIGYKPAKNFSILAGPEIGYLIRARSHFDNQDYDIYSSMDRRFNVDADAGISWNLTKELSMDARFSFGVTPLYRGLLTDEFGTEIGRVNDGYHRVLQVGFSLAL